MCLPVVAAFVACDAPCASAGLSGIDVNIKQSALAMNDEAIVRYERERSTLGDDKPWLALVPGTSEQWGHHKAPPRALEATGVLISDEFKSRLDRAFKVLAAGDVRFVVVSGGAVDRDRPDYNEAERGRDYLIARGIERARVFIDPIAKSSTANVRNAAKLAQQLGLDRIVILTTMPEAGTLTPADVATQGYYFLYHAVSTFDSRARAQFGYALGSFSRIMLGDAPAITHCNFHPELQADDYGP